MANQPFVGRAFWLLMFWNKLPMAWETIIEEWRDSVSYEAIAEGVRLSRQAFLESVWNLHIEEEEHLNWGR